MTTEVGLQKDGEIAVITVDNPPVNALKQVVRAGLLSTLTQARGDGRRARRCAAAIGEGEHGRGNTCPEKALSSQCAL